MAKSVLPRTNGYMEATENELFRLTEAPESVLAAAAMDPLKARKLIEDCRWPEGPVCPSCGSGHLKRMEDKQSLAMQRWRCCEADCKRRFNWRVGTQFFAIHSGPELILTALLEIRRGRSAAETIAFLMREPGMSKMRAQHLVLALLELSVSALSTQTDGSSFRLAQLQREQRETEGELKKARRAMLRARAGRGCLVAAAVWGLVGMSISPVAEPPKVALVKADDTQKVAVWFSGGERRRVICEREAGEAFAAWSRRYNDAISVMTDRYPPDK